LALLENILHPLSQFCHVGMVLAVTRYHPELQCMGIHRGDMVQRLVPHLEILVQKPVLKDAKTDQLMTVVQVWPPLDLAHQEPPQHMPVVGCSGLRAAAPQGHSSPVLADSLQEWALASDSIRLDPFPP
jgi:hypothetical protein